MATRSVLVTGGSSGIGRAIVARFARAGDRVWFTFCSGAQRAQTIVDELTMEGFSEISAVSFSQGTWHSHQRLAREMPDGVDILVNNAAVGTATVRSYVPGSEHDRDAAFLQINCVGPLWLIRQFSPGMIERGYGKIVNISSVGGGIAPFPGFHIADGMSKAALAYLTRHLAAEWAHTPIDVFALCPGAVETPMLQASMLGALSPGQRKEMEAALPRARLIQPEEIAELVWWLCHDKASVLHGAVIDASMGLGAHPGLITRQHHSNEVIESGHATADPPTGW
jgi:NAD(P)-dependent dehydrogenase (short-subunit alcohol dehydrogenase family)